MDLQITFIINCIQDINVWDIQVRLYFNKIFTLSAGFIFLFLFFVFSSNLTGRRKSTAATNPSSSKQDQLTPLGEVDKPFSSVEVTETEQGEEESQAGGVSRSLAGEEMIPVPDIFRQGQKTNRKYG